MVVVLSLSIGTIVVGFGVIYRRNWGRIFSMVIAGLWILFGWWEVTPLLQLPGSDIPAGYMALHSFPIVAAIIWLALFARKGARMEFLPGPIVPIQVNLLGDGLFELLPTDECDPSAERWEFQPGSIVRGVQTRHYCEARLLAVSFDR
jgi:hypothetical protein